MPRSYWLSLHRLEISTNKGIWRIHALISPDCTEFMAVHFAPLALGPTLIRALVVSTVFFVVNPAAAQFVPGLEYSNQPALAAINLLPAYNAGLSGLGIRIGVVDTGINPNHVEFTGALVAGYDAMTGRSGTSNFSSFLVDYDLHGSHVASIAAARLDGVSRQDNIQGVAYNASLVVGSVNFGALTDEKPLGSVIDYVSSQGVKVINNSWGSDSAGKGDPRLLYERNLPEEREVIRAIHTALDRGSVLVFAAGNESKPGNVAINPTLESTFPAYDAAMAAKGGFIVVAATTNDGSALTSYANHCGVAKNYCIAAPGGGGQYPLPEGKTMADEFIVGADALTNDAYLGWAGSSMASPLVSGTVALVAEQFPWMTNKNLSVTILTTGSRAANPDVEWGRGLLNVGKAILGPGIFEETFEANVTSGYMSVFGNDISGIAGLSKFGAGILTLSGANTYAGDTVISGGVLKINGSVVSNTIVGNGGILGGTGTVANVIVASGGRLAPGNSPGTLTANGSVVQLAGSALDIEIDGPGTGNGPGNYDRLVVTGAGSTYTAGGSFNVQLRGIGTPASNTYSPQLGKGFQVVSAPGGVLGSFDTLMQPSAGLLPGTRLDLVYGATGLALYATPSSYADIAAAGVVSNSNRQQIGAILQSRRPAAGRREDDPNIKRLFDTLAVQSARTLPLGIDQLGGVGYAQLIGMNLENSKFLVKQTMLKMARQRRGEGHSWRSQNGSDMSGELTEDVWGQVIGRTTTWRGDDLGYSMNDTLFGLMGGFQKELDAQTLAGISMAYAESNPELAQGMGRGPQQSLQLMGYASYRFGDGYFLEGTAGGGIGSIDATRRVGMLNTQYHATINTANVAASLLTGWGVSESDALSYETSLGVGYLSMRSLGFSDTGNQQVGALRGEPTTNTSLAAAIGGSVSMPFFANGIDWRISAQAALSHEFADNRARLDASFLGNSIEVKGAAIGRNRLALKTSLIGQVGKLTHIALDIGNESASNWNASSLALSFKREF
jgi:subtilase-type serine protease